MFVFDSFLCYYATIITVVISLLRQQTDTKRNPWVVLYTHIAQLMTHTTCIHSCCLPCNYVTKPFGILKRVNKSQRVHISEKSLKLLSTIYFFHRMIVHDKGLDTKEKLKLTFYSYLIIKTSSFQKKSFMATRSRSQTNFSKKKLWQYQNSHLHLHQKEEIVLHYLQFSLQHLWMK